MITHEISNADFLIYNLKRRARDRSGADIADKVIRSHTASLPTDHSAVVSSVEKGLESGQLQPPSFTDLRYALERCDECHRNVKEESDRLLRGLLIGGLISGALWAGIIWLVAGWLA